MADSDLRAIADAVLRRAEQQGSVLPREIRALVTEAGQPEDRWKEVVEEVRDRLRYRAGRYYPASGSERVRREQDQQQAILKAVKQLVKLHKAAGRDEERREQARTDFVQLVRVRTEDGKESTLLSRDISATGIRLIGTRRLLGHKVRVLVGRPGDASASGEGWSFLVRILWTCALGEDLFENGGSFLEVESAGR
jgi:hypothetical protein